MTAPLVLAEGSAKVTQIGPRLLWTALVLLVLLALYGLMWRGWRSRGRRQGDLPAPPPAPPQGAVLLGPVEGVYVSTTSEGDWLDRIVAHGLGVRAQSQLTVEDAGVRVERQGESTLWVPVDAVRGARLAPGMAGKFVGEGGLVVLTWQLGPGTLDTGFRARYADDRDAVLDALTVLADRGAAL